MILLRLCLFLRLSAPSPKVCLIPAQANGLGSSDISVAANGLSHLFFSSSDPDSSHRRPLHRFHHLNVQIPIRLPTARAHLQPITDFPFHLSQHFVARRASHPNRSNVRTGMLRGPNALFL